MRLRRTWHAGPAALLLLCTALPAAAQSARIPAVGEDTLPGGWRETHNPAGLAGAGLTGSVRFRAVVLNERGSLHRPQQPAGVRTLSFGMHGDREAGGWHSVGGLTYERRQDDQVHWSNVAEPYRGFPYVWADSIGGDWFRDGARAHGAIATPVVRGARLGALLTYTVAQGARRNDPRPLFRLREIEVAPGIEFHVGTHQQVGIRTHVRSRREENEVGQFAGDDPFVYRLRGPGTFDRSQLVRAERTISGRALGADVHHTFAAGRSAWSNAVGIEVAEDSAREGIASPRPGGSYRRTTGHFRSALRRTDAGRGFEARLSGDAFVGEGTDPVFDAVNPRDTGVNVTARTSRWWNDEAGATRLETAFDFGVTSVSMTDLATETYWRVTAWRAAGEAAIRRPLLGHDIVGQARLGYRGPVADEFRATRPTELTAKLVEPDYQLHATATGELGIDIGYEWRLAADAVTRITVHAHTRAARVATDRPGRTRFAIALELER